jgi:TRAP-type uncharacterized transport system fused permease subunit
VVFLAAPALQEFGIPPLVTHFMIFYFSAAAMITPPVAPAALVASGIAGTGFMRTGWEAMKLGSPFLILPLAFVVYPELIEFNSGTIAAVLIVQVALLLVSYGFYKPGWSPKMLLKKGGAIVGACVLLSSPRKELNFLLALLVLGTYAFSAYRLRSLAVLDLSERR